MSVTGESPPPNAKAPPSAKVRVLPPALADQIAAGEVVERPASVVKELVENAIDAGARRIDVEIDGGGRRLVRVVDDGSGMEPDDARLALRRHATSKLTSAEDLWGLRTFGFRGEALPSIAAVSRLTLTTRPPEADAGFRLTVEAGVETDARAAGIPIGTQVEVRDLFFNTPARAKFLKAEATETANVSEAILRLALAHPGVHFRLRVGGRVALDLPPHPELGERVRAALARRGAGALHEAAGVEGGHTVRAFLADPEEASNTTRSTFLFVGRPVRARSVAAARAGPRLRPPAREGALPAGGAVPRAAGGRGRRQRPPAEAGGPVRARPGGLRRRPPRRGRRDRARPLAARAHRRAARSGPSHSRPLFVATRPTQPTIAPWS